MPKEENKAMTLDFTIRIGDAEPRYSMLNSGLDLNQRFGLKHLTFAQTIEIQKRFHDLAKQIGHEYQPSAAELKEWEEAQKNPKRW